VCPLPLLPVTRSVRPWDVADVVGDQTFAFVRTSKRPSWRAG
jgi:hypothetical protein